MRIYTRDEWGARPARAANYRHLNDEATIHWSASTITDAGEAGSNDPKPLVKPRKPGRKWYQLWRDPTTPKAQRRAISKVIRQYNLDRAFYNKSTPGMKDLLDPKLVENEKRIVRSFQNYHMDTHGWSDIGYHYLIFASGNVYLGRNINYSGAHAINANHTTGICFVMGPGDQPTPQMIASFYELRSRDGIKRYRGHKQVPGNATACPGPDLTARLNLPVGY